MRREHRRTSCSSRHSRHPGKARHSIPIHMKSRIDAAVFFAQGILSACLEASYTFVSVCMLDAKQRFPDPEEVVSFYPHGPTSAEWTSTKDSSCALHDVEPPRSLAHAKFHLAEHQHSIDPNHQRHGGYSTPIASSRSIREQASQQGKRVEKCI